MSANQPDVADDPRPGRQRHRQRTEAICQPVGQAGCISGSRNERTHGLLVVVVAVEPVTLPNQTIHDGLDVVPRSLSHLVADGLRLVAKLRLLHAVAQLAQLVPDLLALATAITLEETVHRCDTG